MRGAGLLFAFYMLSGYGQHGQGVELDAIAAVVIGGTLLTGGTGLVAGTFVGLLIQGLIQTYIVFDGTLSSWWTKIVIGMLLFAVTGLTLNHAAKIEAKPQVQNQHLELPADLLGQFAFDTKFPVGVITGILGALLGGWIASILFDIDVNEKFFDLGTWIFAIIGGVIVAAVWQAITRRTGTRA